MPVRSHDQFVHDIDIARQFHVGGRTRDAEEICRVAIAEGHSSLQLATCMAEILKDTGRAEEAILWYRKAIALAPRDVRVSDALAALLVGMGRQLDALKALAAALKVVPDSARTLTNFGALLVQMGRAADAEGILRRAIELSPRDADLRVHLGIALHRLRRDAETEGQFRTGLAIQPDSPSLCNILANVCRLQGKMADAEAYYRKAMALDPAFPDAPSNYGGMLRQVGRVGEAKAMLRRALKLRSPWPEIHSNLIFCLDFDGESGLQEQQEERARWRAAVEAPLAAQRYRHPAGADPGKRLRIGYVSGDFSMHSASDMFGGVLLNHDLQAHDVHLYSSRDLEDARTTEFVAHSTQFRRVFGRSDAKLAARIREDGIDILVDLSGHSAHNRLPAFALRPAPVQVTAWGYATGTGLRSIDYFLADARLVPEHLRPQFSETVFYLPCFLIYRPPAYLPEPLPAPSAARGHITFGCMNRLAKAGEACLATWARLLHRVPGSRLLLKCETLDDSTVRSRVATRFAESGIGEERLDLRGRTPHIVQLQTYGDVDIALDPFPHCGGTTTCEALMMGVPVVSLCGEVPVARNGFALLGAVGFEEWVAQDPDGYIDKAAALAADTARLQSLRSQLRPAVLASPVGDTAGYARTVEAAYREIWVRYCRAGAASGGPEQR